MKYICPNKDQTLSDLLADYSMVINVQAFLDTKDLITGQSNWDKIKRKYSPKELADNEPEYPGDGMLVKAGTVLEMRVSYFRRNIMKLSQPDTFRSTEFKPFIASAMAELLKNPTYTKIVDSSTGEQISLVNNDITVYIWCRGMSNPNSSAQEGTWLNVSAFIQNISTRKDDVGVFSFSLSPVVCEWSEFFGWQLSGDVTGYDSGSVRDDVLSTSMLRDKFLFNTVLQANDLVYIRFEKLEMDQELDSRLREVNGRLSATDIPGRAYDMIGLIDFVSTSAEPGGVNISVQGRDLMKLLIEDGSYFFPEQFAQNIFTDENSILTKRNRVELEIQSLTGASYTFKPIQTILKFIFNKFSNIGIVSGSAFNGYGSRAIKDKYELKTSELKSTSLDLVIDQINERFLREKRQGVWQICEFVFDPQVANRVLADNSISQDNGSIINSIKQICQEPFVEFTGDTYMDKFYFFIRKQPFDTKGYRGLVYGDHISEEENGAIGGDRQIDNIKKKIQIERSGLTIGRTSELSDLVIDIDDSDVLAEPDLGYHDEAYSWYRIIPRGLGIADEMSSFLLAPVVPFDEYAEVWGNRTYTMEYQYAPTEYLQDSEVEPESKFAETQTFYDLQFLIQSHQYLPFTRRGTIVLTGNRTIKRGLFVYYKPTKEVFYVDSVIHSRSMDFGQDRSTTIQVSRGMREPYIKGKLVQFPSGPKTVSYFDIINTEVANDASINNKDFLKNWKVDKDVFNFFLQRRQWAD